MALSFREQALKSVPRLFRHMCVPVTITTGCLETSRSIIIQHLMGQPRFTIIRTAPAFRNTQTSGSRYEMAPIDDRSKFAGPFTRLGVHIKPSRITDGLSKTIFVGEVRVPCSVNAQAGWATTLNGNGYCTTLIPINFDTCNTSASDPCHRPCTWNTDVGFKSAHSGGAISFWRRLCALLKRLYRLPDVSILRR